MDVDAGDAKLRSGEETKDSEHVAASSCFLGTRGTITACCLWERRARRAREDERAPKLKREIGRGVLAQL